MDSLASTSSPFRGWRLDEVASAGRENLDVDHVDRYDSKEDADAGGEVERLKILGLSSSSIVLEFGVGTGQFTMAAAPWCERVIAVDVSPPMLARLQAKIDAARIENVDVVQSGFVSYQHAGDQWMWCIHGTRCTIFRTFGKALRLHVFTRFFVLEGAPIVGRCL
jgi:SAM-dependent methyltransferase